MVSVNFYFQVHQPYRLRQYRIFEIGQNRNYFDDIKNKEVMKKVANKCYLPTNKLMLDLIDTYGKEFNISYSITGTAIEQFQQYSPEVLDSFKELAKTGSVEFINETYYHSLSYLFDKEEFTQQVRLHKKAMQNLFRQTPTTFRNTELIFNNELAHDVKKMGYEAIIAEGWDHYLGWKSPNFLYESVSAKGLPIMLKNYKLSDDIAFRFSNKGWTEHPLSVEKYGQWVNSANGNGEMINLFMDYETFGEHQWADTGIFDFMRHLPNEVLKHPDNNFLKVGDAAKKYQIKGELDIHNYLSWADMERDLSAWLGNPLQDSSAKELYKIQNAIKKTGDQNLIQEWRKLTTSDHFYYMCTKYFNDGDVHKYFNPYDTPYEGFITFMNVLNDLAVRVRDKTLANNLKTNFVTENPSSLLEVRNNGEKSYQKSYDYKKG